MPKTFVVAVTRQITLREGYGVWFMPVYAGEDTPNPDAIVGVEAGIVRIAPDTIRLVGGEPCIATKGNSFVLAQTFEELDDLACDDTHDLRDRWFATKEEAEEHLAYTLKRFYHPAPWESFVCVE